MTTELGGPQLFARFAYPPNALGYCGPEDHRALLEYGSSGVVDGGLVQLARGFEGAWPYLELIAGAAGLDDPLDERVVEAYWLGTALAQSVSLPDLGLHVAERFGPQAGRAWDRLAESLPGGHPSHAFHVFAVYPFVGLLRSGVVDEPLRVLDRCRVRWGRVEALDGATAVVSCRPLVLDRGELRLGDPVAETARFAEDGLGLVADLAAGDVVALHWDWVCDRIDRRQLAALRSTTRHHLDLVNATSRPGVEAG